MVLATVSIISLPLPSWRNGSSSFTFGSSSILVFAVVDGQIFSSDNYLGVGSILRCKMI